MTDLERGSSQPEDMPEDGHADNAAGGTAGETASGEVAAEDPRDAHDHDHAYESDEDDGVFSPGGIFGDTPTLPVAPPVEAGPRAGGSDVLPGQRGRSATWPPQDPGPETPAEPPLLDGMTTDAVSEYADRYAQAYSVAPGGGGYTSPSLLPVLDGSGPPALVHDPADFTALAWDEHRWHEALGRARRDGRAYVYLNLVEQRLRSLVSEVLHPVFSTDPGGYDDGAWIAAAAGAGQVEWVERAVSVREMSRRRGYIVDPADDDLIAFLTLPQLRELVVRNWWCFAPYLADRRALERALEEVEIGRHIVARNRILSPEVLGQVERACVRVLALLDGPLADEGAAGRLALDAVEELFAGRYADVVGVFTDRAALQRQLPFAELVGEARSIDAVGICLNLLCQNFSGRDLVRLGTSGCRMRLLFLNPSGDAMRRRERDEGVKRGLLSRMATLNILHARRVRARLPQPERVEIRLYDETPRLNSYLIDGQVAVVQPYLRRQRGVESPSFVLRRGDGGVQGLYPLFQEEFEHLWATGKRTAGT